MGKRGVDYPVAFFYTQSKERVVGFLLGEHMENTRYWVDRDGSIYGPFSAQKDGFPHAGEVIEHYRTLVHMTRSDLAHQLGVSIRRVQQMENENKVPDSMERRRFIAQMLGIPPLLLGLASVDDFLRPAQSGTVKSAAITRATRLSVDTETIDQYRSQLSLFWSLHYTSTASSVMVEIQRNITHLQALIACTTGEQQESLIEQLCGFYELASRIHSDQSKPQDALLYLNDAIELASPLKDRLKELYGRLLYKRGLVRYEARDYSGAFSDLNAANTLVPHLTAPLAGSILLELGLVKAYLAQQSGGLVDRTSSLRYFDQAEKYMKLSQNNGGMGIKYDNGRYLTARAEGLIVLGRLEDAQDALDDASGETSLELTRRLLFVNIQEAKCLAAQGEVYSAAELAQEAVQKAIAVKSVYSLSRINEVYQMLTVKTSKGPVEELGYFITRARSKVM